MKKRYVATSSKEKLWGEIVMMLILLCTGIVLILASVYSLIYSFYVLGLSIGALGWLLISVCWWSLFESKFYCKTFLFKYDEKIIYNNCVLFVLENDVYKFSLVYKKFEGIPILVYYNAFGKFLKLLPYKYYPLELRWWWNDK